MPPRRKTEPPTPTTPPKPRGRIPNEGKAREAQIAEFLLGHPEGTTSTAIAAALGYPSNSINVYLPNLVARGEARRIRRGLYGPPVAGAAPPGVSAPGAVGGGVELVSVSRVTDGVLQVQGRSEAAWYDATRDSYMAQTHFSETTDLQDLDRLLSLELLVHRWVGFLASGRDYTGAQVDEEGLKKSLREYSAELVKVKDSMGLSRKVRDAAANNGDFASYVAQLRIRAKEFGIHREKQVALALNLMNDLSAHVGAFDRSDKEEREKLGFPDEHSLLEWVRKIMIPRFHEIDRAWIASTQKYWTAER
jgi:hypothetical protein